MLRVQGQRALAFTQSHGFGLFSDALVSAPVRRGPALRAPRSAVWPLRPLPCGDGESVIGVCAVSRRGTARSRGPARGFERGWRWSVPAVRFHEAIFTRECAPRDVRVSYFIQLMCAPACKRARARQHTILRYCHAAPQRQLQGSGLNCKSALASSAQRAQVTRARYQTRVALSAFAFSEEGRSRTRKMLKDSYHHVAPGTTAFSRCFGGERPLGRASCRLLSVL